MMENMTPQDRITDALNFAASYGTEDGAHHKMWVIDQMVRCLTGCPLEERTTVINGTPYPFQELGESDEYRTFVAEHNAGEEGPDTYSWDEGIAP
jgi:hypothetical protein